MAGQPKYDWPDDDALVEIVVAAGGVVQAAAQMGINGSTLDSRIRTRRLRAQIRTAIEEKIVIAEAAAEPGVSREELLADQLREARLALTKDRKAAIAQERIVQAVEQALEAVPLPTRGGPVKIRAAAKDAAHHRQLVVWSDWHGGERVDPEVVNGLNAYSWQIMEDRVQEMVAAMLSHKRHAPALTGLDIAIVGDMCSGANHEELKVSNEYPLAVQGVKIGYLLGKTIEGLLGHYSEIRVVSVEGNHPRLEQKPAAKSPENNMDWVAGIIAAEYLKPHGIEWTHGRGSVIHEIAGRNIYIWHGDGIRSTMPGVPWGGVMRRVNEIAANSRVRLDHFLCGHFHQPNVVQGGRIMMNGSLKGVDEWVLKHFGGGAAPTQLLFTFDEKHGRLVNNGDLLTPTAGLDLVELPAAA